MRAKNYLRPEAVDVSLLERNRLRQDVKAGAHQVNVKYLVVANDAVNTLVVVSAVDRSEVYLDTDKRLCFDYTLSDREAKYVRFIRKKLEADWQV